MPRLLRLHTATEPVHLTKRQRGLVRQAAEVMRVYHTFWLRGQKREAEHRTSILMDTWLNGMDPPPQEWANVISAILRADDEAHDRLEAAGARIRA